MNIWDGLTHPDEKIRSAHEEVLKAIKNRSFRPATPLYDSTFRFGNLKSFIKYELTMIGYYFEKVSLKKVSIGIRNDVDNILKTAIELVALAEPIKKTIHCWQCEDKAYYPRSLEDKPCEYHTLFKILDRKLEIYRSEFKKR